MAETEMVECPECGGDGELEINCYACDSLTMETCEECDGAGEVESTTEEENV